MRRLVGWIEGSMTAEATLTPERTHIASKPEPFVIEAREQLAKPEMKPRGLWYEVDGDWRRWCTDEGMEWRFGYLFRLELDGEKMLRISSPAELDDFDSAYHVTEHIARPGYGLDPYDMCRGIRWDEVAATYDGIEIAPYLWERRLDGHTWYYGWDCASGVVWRPKGARLTFIEAILQDPDPRLTEQESR